MDDFYSEMKDVLEQSFNSKVEEPKLSSYSSQSSSIYAEAAALVPINPRRWPAFTAGSAANSEMPQLGDKLTTPLDNLVVTKEYLETAQSDLQWRSRLWQVGEDTVAINIASEVAGDVGAFAAGASANKIAEKYMNEMINTELTKNEPERLNFEIFKQVAREQNVDPSTVRGTGVFREFVPEYLRDDICDRPERYARPKSWNNFGEEGGEDVIDTIVPKPRIPGNGGQSSNLPSSSSSFSSSSNSTVSDSTVSDKNYDEGIFDKIVNFIAFGTGKMVNFLSFGGSSGPEPTATIASSSSAEEAEKARDNAERSLMGGWFNLDNYGSGYPLCPMDPSHPSLNPPPFSAPFTCFPDDL